MSNCRRLYPVENERSSTYDLLWAVDSHLCAIQGKHLRFAIGSTPWTYWVIPDLCPKEMEAL